MFEPYLTTMQARPPCTHILRQLVLTYTVHCRDAGPRSSTPFTRASRPVLQRGVRNGTYRRPPNQRRGLFGFSMFGKNHEAKEANIDPGLAKMMELEKMQRLRARPPPVQDVAHALHTFFEHRQLWDSGIEDNQARLALQALQYWTASFDGRADAREVENRMSRDIIYNAVGALLRTRRQWSQAHADLAQQLHDLALVIGAPGSTLNNATLVRVIALASTGGLVEACATLLAYRVTATGVVALKREHEVTPESHAPVEPSIGSQYFTLRALHLAGCATLETAARSEDELLSTYKNMDERGLCFHCDAIRVVVEFYMRRNDAHGVRQWTTEFITRFQHSVPQVKIDVPFGTTIDRILKWCLEQKEIELGHDIIKKLTTANPAKPVWDAILVWAAGNGESVEEIGRMIDLMETSNKAISDKSQWRVADVTTINALVDFANSRNNPYLAERFIELGRERRIQPDGKTYTLQMDYRLASGDVDGALKAYRNMREALVSSNDDIASVNRLIVALCGTRRHGFDTIMDLAADLSMRKARFEPGTVVSLGQLHLSRHEKHDALDLLNTHAYRYSSSERETVRKALVSYCTDPSTTLYSAWSGYTMLLKIFDEMPRSERTELMVSFFRRSRPDMGVRVFQDMRGHSRPEVMPTMETYASSFMCLAQLRDLENLELVHNQLKLDFNVTTSTHGLNALMIAYTACGAPQRALSLWHDIVASPEGPSYNSIHVVLRACEKTPFGDVAAQQVWRLLRNRGIELDQAMWASYIAALTGTGDTELAMGTLEAAVDKGYVEADAYIIGSMMDGAAGPTKQEDIERWAKTALPQAWSNLEKLGVKTDRMGMRRYNIDRSVAP